MSRLYLIIFLLFSSSVVFSQTELKQYLKFAQEKYEEGDFIYALRYYDKAMEIDSNSINTLWEYAETLRAYKDYPKAAYYYGKVYDREGGELYPASLLNYGLMVKQTGDYDKALEIFKRAKKKYRKDSRGYLSQKSKREIQSCSWAKSNEDVFSDLIFEQLPEHINTPNAEFSHRTFDNKLLFSSLRADSIGAAEEVYETSYRTHLFTSEIEGEEYKEDQAVNGLNWDDASTGNGTFSLDGKRFYFSYCNNQGANYSCKILVARKDNDRFTAVDTLGEIVNFPGANTTMPFIGEWEGDEVLFYSSDRADGKGGMDIWYSFIKNGNQYSKPRNVRKINSLDNELSPFWDAETTTLYFSSSWHDGFGGYDVFKTTYQNGAFQDPENMMQPINSPANDLYYFETITEDTAYFSSNRLGSNYSKNPTCCSDVYLVRKPLVELPPTVEETLEDLNKRLPVTLYFHNDIPNPRSWDTVTKLNYMESYTDYIGMLDQYKKEYSNGLKGEKAADAKDDIEDFFTEYVEQGVKDLEQFSELLRIELERGRKVELTVKGFASPLAKTDYNVNLAKRRISSLKNYLRDFEGGVFQEYLDKTAANGGGLTIVPIPYGEYQASQITSDNPNDVKNSVFSRAAAIERKIEIQSVDIIRGDDQLSTILSANQLIFDAGMVKEGTVITKDFILKNIGEQTIQIKEVKTSSQATQFEFENKVLQPGESLPIKVLFNTEGLKGHSSAKVEIMYNDFEKGLELTIVGEIE